MKKSILFLFVFIILGVSKAFAAPTGKVEGRVMFHDKPVSGALVYAYRDPADLFSKPPAAGPVTSDADGRFLMELRRGRYYFAAKKKVADAKETLEPGDLYSFYGGNPILVDPARPAKLTLNMVVKPPLRECSASKDGRGGVEGVVTFNGQPLDGVVLYVYLDANDSFRGLGYYMSPPTGVDGSFKMRMSPGTYYIIARKRIGGGLAGPLHEGDYFGYPDFNPVVVDKGKIARVELPVVRKVERNSPGGQGMTAISGIIKDKAGKPVSGAYACLYKNEAMTDRPALVSKQTGADGRFEVEIPLGGKYYLGARSEIGGPVEPGQLWGRFDGSQDHSVAVETGKTVDGLEIVVEKVSLD